MEPKETCPFCGRNRLVANNVSEHDAVDILMELCLQANSLGEESLTEAQQAFHHGLICVDCYVDGKF